MSLQDILMERAALHFQNTLGPTSGGTPSDLFSYIAETVKEEREKKLEKEEYNTNLKKSWDEIKNRIKNSDKDRMDYQVEIGTDKKGNLIPSLAMKSKSLESDTVPVQLVDTITGEVETVGNVPKNSKTYIKKREGEDINIYQVDPITGEMVNVGTAPYGSKVYKGIMSPEDIQKRAEAEGRGKAIEENIKTTSKLANAVSRLAVLNKQFNEALPTGDKTPIEQRIGGNINTWAAKAGIVDNSKLVALQKNIRPIAIQMIRAFGEVGNLSETEQQGAIDVVTMQGITEEERAESVKQFIEFALAGASPESVRYIKDRKDIQGILDAYGVDLSSFGVSESLIDNNTGLNLNNVFSGIGGY